MIADIILIPVILLILFKISYNKDGIYEDYLSVERTNILKGIMALDVVLFHFTLDNVNVSSKFLQICQGDDAVKIFFFLSGYGLMYQYTHKGRDYLNGFFSKRLAKVFVPFIIAAIPYIFFFVASGSYYYSETGLTLSAVFSEFFNYGYTIVYNGWFVVELIILYVVFYLCAALSRGNTQKAVNACVVAVMLLMCAFWALNNYGNWLYIWFYSIYAFAMGIIWGYKEKAIFKFISKKFDYIFMLIIPVVIFIILLRRIYLYSLPAEMYILSKNMLLGPFIVLGVIIAGMKIKVNCKVWKYIGNISYELYLIHGLFYTMFRSALMYIENDLLFVLAVITASFAGAIIIHFISKYILKGYFSLLNKITEKA